MFRALTSTSTCKLSESHSQYTCCCIAHHVRCETCFVHPSIHPSIRPSVRPSIHPSTHPSIHGSSRLRSSRPPTKSFRCVNPHAHIVRWPEITLVTGALPVIEKDTFHGIATSGTKAPTSSIFGTSSPGLGQHHRGRARPDRDRA